MCRYAGLRLARKYTISTLERAELGRAVQMALSFVPSVGYIYNSDCICPFMGDADPIVALFMKTDEWLDHLHDALQYPSTAGSCPLPL